MSIFAQHLHKITKLNAKTIFFGIFDLEIGFLWSLYPCPELGLKIKCIRKIKNCLTRLTAQTCYTCAQSPYAIDQNWNENWLHWTDLVKANWSQMTTKRHLCSNFKFLMFMHERLLRRSYYSLLLPINLLFVYKNNLDFCYFFLFWFVYFNSF